MDFTPFPKIARLSRECTITEKIDGTNASVTIVQLEGAMPEPGAIYQQGSVALFAASRSRWITPQDDNFGFAKWVLEHAEELISGLGVGTHFGEWWGAGVGRRYDQEIKHFALFNTAKWGDARPACCGVVPVLYNGLFDTEMAMAWLEYLRVKGSRIAPGFMKPEGIIIYHHAANLYFKKTLDKDEEWKGKSQ